MSGDEALIVQLTSVGFSEGDARVLIGMVLATYKLRSVEAKVAEQRDRITALESAVRIGILYVRDTAARTNDEGCWRDLDSIQKALLGPDPRALLGSTTTEAEAAEARRAAELEHYGESCP